jgi:Dullard-like phosphatase family protein
MAAAGGASHASVLSAVNEILSASTPLERLRPRNIRANMMQYIRFNPLLNIDGAGPDCPWPTEDPYRRFGADRFAQEGPVFWYEPLPPMMADLERYPILPPSAAPDTYTLVLDLDETLVHYFEVDGQGSYGVRPGMFEFLDRMSALGYEIVIFTAATQDYADWVIGQIDPKGLVHHRLYRQDALPWGPLFCKDLSRLGRDLDRTLIIDNVQENFMKHPNHGIFISTWYDDLEDTALPELTPMLEELIQTRACVPDIMHKYKDQIPVWAGFGQYYDDDGSFEGGPMAPGHHQLEEPEPMEPPPRVSELPPQQQMAPPQRQAQPLAPIRSGAAMTQPGAADAGAPPPYAQQQDMLQQGQRGIDPAQRQQPAAAWSQQGSSPAGPYQAGSPLQRGPYQVAPVQAQRPAFSARGITGAHQYVPPSSQHRPASALGAGAQYQQTYTGGR